MRMHHCIDTARPGRYGRSAFIMHRRRVSMALSKAPSMAFCAALFSAILLIASGVGCATPAVRKPVAARENPVLPPLDAKTEAALDQRVDTLAHFAAGLHHELNDQPAEATDQFVQAAMADLRDEPLVLDAARRLVRAQKNPEAIDLLKKAAAMPGAPGTYHTWLGLAYLQNGQTNEAAQANLLALQLVPDNLAAYQNLAALHLQSGRTNDATAILNRAAARTNAPPEFLLGLADLFARYNRQQLFTDADAKQRILRLLDATAAQKPANPLFLQRTADLYLLHGETAKAEPIYAGLLAAYPSIPGLRERLANIYLRTGKNQEAAKLLAEISQENPTEPTTHYFLGSLAYEAKQYDQAAEHYETALRLNPDFEPVYYDLAGVHLARRLPAEALALLEQARSRFKLSFTLEFYAGLAYSMMEKWSDALGRLTSAELLAKTSEPQRLTHVYYFQLGSTYERSGNIPDAVTALRKSLELNPNFPDALNYLGYMWADRGENLEEARSMIERAVQAEPENEAYLDSLAWVLFKLGRPQEALPHMRRAITLSEKPDPTLLDHLGDILAALQQIPEARDAYRQSLAAKPDPKVQEKADLLNPR